MQSRQSDFQLSRRGLIKLMAAGAGTLALASTPFARAAGEGAAFKPNAFLEISKAGGVVLWVKKAEMGQHIHTATAMMMADELGADLETMTLKQADTHPRFGFVGTGGSFAMPGRWLYMRPLFAAAREMLLKAAAEAWRVPVAELRAIGGEIQHAGAGRKARLEDFAARASSYDVPENPSLRPHDEFRYMGKSRGRLDTPEVLTGKARYGIDVRPIGVRFAVMARSGARDGKLVSFDGQAALNIPGVEEVHRIGDKVAVIATNSWAAMRGREALKAEWDAGKYADVRNARIRNQLAEAFTLAPRNVRTDGRLPQGAPVVDAVYEMPMAQHAALEPVNATALVEDGTCTVWGPIQMATLAKNEIVELLGLAEDKVTVHTTLLGGSFGRKLERHYVMEAVQVAAKTSGPVQLLLTREDDMIEGGVRPPSIHHIKLWHADGPPSFRHEYATLSVNAQQDPGLLERKGYDWTSALGAVDVPYGFSSLEILQHDVVNHAVRLNWWRGTHHNHHAFATECALDEYAVARGEDPISLRLSLLANDLQVESYPDEVSTVSAVRLRGVLRTLRQVTAATNDHTPNSGLGIACHVYTDVFTYVAHAVDVTVRDGQVKINKVWAVVDCGLAVSPDAVKAQMEGAVVFGLTSALWGDLEVEAGRIMTRNFDTCRLMRLNEAPEVEVIIVDNGENPGGMGEPPLPSVTPAFLNAVARAGGPRIRSLPIGDQLEIVKNV